MLFQSLKELFTVFTDPQAATPAQADEALKLATAVLLTEVMRADTELAASERTAVLDALRDKFGLTGDAAGHLLDDAAAASRQASDFFAFTSQINERFDMPQKLRVVEHMWRVAYADGTLSAHENHLMRKVADLLYIPHGAYINAKMRAQGAAAGDAPT